MTTVLLTVTITMESRARIVNRSTSSQKDMKKQKDMKAVFSNIQVALCWTSFAKARVEIQISLYFHFLEQNHAVDNYTWR